MTEETKEETSNEEEVRHILKMVRWLLILIFVVIGFFILKRLAPVLTPVVAAAGVAYLLDGWVDALEAKGVNRTAAVAALLVAFIGVVTALILLVAPLITAELLHFTAALPGMLSEASGWVSENFGFELPVSWTAYMESEEFKNVLKEAAGPLAGMTAAALGGLLSLLGFLAEMLLVPVFAFYFLVDWDRMVARARTFIPPRHREQVGGIVVEIDAAVSTWIRGQFIVISLLAVLYAVAFRIIGVEMGITIGALVGLLTIIPFVGTVVGAAITVLIMLLSGASPAQFGAVVGVFVFLHLLEAAFLTPKIVGKKVGLGEVGALFAVLAGGNLLGFVGVLLAVPLAASVAVLVRRAFDYYEQSEFFTEGEDPSFNEAGEPAAELADDPAE